MRKTCHICNYDPIQQLICSACIPVNVTDNRLTLVSGDDWEGLFHKGELLDEDHSIQRKTLVRYMRELKTLDINFVDLNDEGIEWLHENGSFPKYFSEIPENYMY